MAKLIFPHNGGPECVSKDYLMLDSRPEVGTSTHQFTKDERAPVVTHELFLPTQSASDYVTHNLSDLGNYNVVAEEDPNRASPLKGSLIEFVGADGKGHLGYIPHNSDGQTVYQMDKSKLHPFAVIRQDPVTLQDQWIMTQHNGASWQEIADLLQPGDTIIPLRERTSLQDKATTIPGEWLDSIREGHWESYGIEDR